MPAHRGYAVRWTEANGRTAERHYLCRSQAERVALRLSQGWRKDARVEAL